MMEQISECEFQYLKTELDHCIKEKERTQEIIQKQTLINLEKLKKVKENILLDPQPADELVNEVEIFIRRQNLVLDEYDKILKEYEVKIKQMSARINIYTRLNNL